MKKNSALLLAVCLTATICRAQFSASGDSNGVPFVVNPITSTGLDKVFVDMDTTNAVSVQANAKAIIRDRVGSNLQGEEDVMEYANGSSPSGPAPLVIDFYSNPSEAVQFYEWFVYDSEDETGTYKRYSDENLNHTFLVSGKSRVKLYVSNTTSKDSASFTIIVTESKLDCPNFFTPRSTPGENDEFRVAYRSIVKFKGTIINRWGNVLFEWTDPSQGWNGTFKGKAVSPGVYFYLIEAKGSDGIVYKKKGDINLLE